MEKIKYILGVLSLLSILVIAGSLSIGHAIVDTDEDGLTDIDEVEIYYTDPLDWDTDDDGCSDGEEIEYDTDPLDPAVYASCCGGGFGHIE